MKSRNFFLGQTTISEHSRCSASLTISKAILRAGLRMVRFPEHLSFPPALRRYTSRRRLYRLWSTSAERCISISEAAARRS